MIFPKGSAIYIRIEEFLLTALIISLPFSNLAGHWHLGFAGSNLTTSFLILALAILWIWHIKTGEVVFPHKKFILLTMAWFVLCLTIGMVTCAYYTDQVNNILMQSSLASFSRKLGLSEQDSIIIGHLRLYFKFLKLMFRDFFLPLFGIYIVFYNLFMRKSLFRKEAQRISIAAFILSLALECFSIPEIVWIWTQSPACESFLKFVNTHIYDIGSAYGSWPPLLLPRVRSLCPEPAIFGILSLFLLPILAMRIINGKKWEIIPIAFLGVMIAGSKSISTIYVLAVMIVIFLTGCAICKYKNWARFLIAFVVLITLTGYVLNLSGTVVGNYVQALHSESAVASLKNDGQQPTGQLMEESFKSNIMQIIETYNKSLQLEYHGPGSRVVETKAAMMTGIQHPIFGVGYGYENAYMAELSTPEMLQIDEYRMFVNYVKQRTFVRSGIPVLNQVTRVFARAGIIGLCLFLTPLAYSLYLVCKKRSWLSRDMGLLMLICMVCGEFISLMGNFIFYPYVISLALLLIYLESPTQNILVGQNTEHNNRNSLQRN